MIAWCAGYDACMNEQTTDPIDADAAEIDARSPDAAEEIEELVEEADDLGRDTPAPDEVDPPTPDGTSSPR